MRRIEAGALDLIVTSGRARLSNRNDPSRGLVAWRTAEALERQGLVHCIEIVVVATEAGKRAVADGIDAEIPERRYEHGTHACYVLDACRCSLCRTANRAYEADRKRDTMYGRPRTVDAGPIREHVQALNAAGVGNKTIAKRSGVAHGALWKLMYGAPDRDGPSRTVRTATAEALLALDPADPALLADGALVPAAPTRRKIAAMVAGGWGKAELARILSGNVDAYTLQVAQPGMRQVTAGHARQIEHLHKLWKAGRIEPRGRWHPRWYGPKPITPRPALPKRAKVEPIRRATCEDCGAPSLGGGRWCWPCFRARTEVAA